MNKLADELVKTYEKRQAAFEKFKIMYTADPQSVEKQITRNLVKTVLAFQPNNSPRVKRS
jgi:hypothetical protein